MLESIEHNSIILKQMLSAAGVIIYLHTEVTSIEKDRLFLKNIKGGIAEIKNDFVIIATGYYIPENEINGLRSCNIYDLYYRRLCKACKPERSNK